MQSIRLEYFALHGGRSAGLLDGHSKTGNCVLQPKDRHSLLWPKATTFEKSQTESATVRCDERP